MTQEARGQVKLCGMRRVLGDESGLFRVSGRSRAGGNVEPQPLLCTLHKHVCLYTMLPESVNG